MLLEEVSILVVDDVNAVRVQVKELLKRFGFKNVEAAQNGEDAKQMIETGAFQLILSDWHMSPSDGLDLLKYVRANPKTSNAAFILVTADNTKENVIAAIEQGVDDYLVKPLTIDRIQNKVYKVLLKRSII
jgi:two-component system chemotaxis response regulator CheY